MPAPPKEWIDIPLMITLVAEMSNPSQAGQELPSSAIWIAALLLPSAAVLVQGTGGKDERPGHWVVASIVIGQTIDSCVSGLMVNGPGAATDGMLKVIVGFVGTEMQLAFAFA